MSHRVSETELSARLSELPREIAPERDPWPEISTRIEALSSHAGSSKPFRGRWFGAAAASVAVVVTAGVLLSSLFDENDLSTTGLVSGEPAAVTRAPELDFAGAPGLLDIVDAEYLAAFREFINTGDSPAGLTPQTIEKIEMGWADLRVTEEALAVALEQNPGDPFLNGRMLELRARQLGFLKQLVSLDRNNRRLMI